MSVSPLLCLLCTLLRLQNENLTQARPGQVNYQVEQTMNAML